MDLIDQVRKFGKNWNLEVNSHFETLCERLHAAGSSQYDGKVKVEEGIKYGQDGRHRLDIYTPASKYSGSNLPVVVYFHGGGFTAGDNSISPCIHANIGKYFASQGCVAVLGTYRLLPEARFPDGAMDIAMALRWLTSNVASYGGNQSTLYPIGQSAGGAHLATALFMGILQRLDLLKHIKGIILQSVPFWYNLKLDRRRNNMMLYHGTDSEDEITSKMSVELFKHVEIDSLAQWPELLIMLGEYDSDEIVNGNLMLVEQYRQRRQRMPLLEIMAGQNHISYALGIGLEGEQLGPRLLAFIFGNWNVGM